MDAHPGSTGSMTPEEVRAREAIRYTQSQYHVAGDRGRLEDLVMTFTEDGVLELSAGAYRGRAAIREGLSGVPLRPAMAGRQTSSFLHHHLTTSHVELTGDSEADAWSYFLVMSPVGVDHCGRYVDHYVAVGDRWLIARRRVTVEWAAKDSAVGATVTARRKG